MLGPHQPTAMRIEDKDIFDFSPPLNTVIAAGMESAHSFGTEGIKEAVSRYELGFSWRLGCCCNNKMSTAFGPKANRNPVPENIFSQHSVPN